MIEALRVAVGIGLPWLAGYAWLRALRRDAASNACIDWGYGHFAGILIVTLLMRLAAFAGLPFSFRVLLPLVLVVTAIGAGWAVRSSRRQHETPSAAPAAADPLFVRGLALVILALLAWRVATLAIDVALRPLFPWDAWTQWGTKARVWAELHAYAPFIPYDAWLARAPGYTDVAPHYPATVPLMQAWMAIAQGRFDDATMNLPWLAGFIALGLAVYGQLRRMASPVTWSLFAAYAVLSLPLLDTHIALAGYADFHVAAAFALALLALIAWEKDRERYQLLLLAATGALLPLLKVPGLVWGAIVALGFLVAAFGASWKRVLILGAATGAVALAGAALFWREKISSVTGGAPVEILGSLADNLFLFDNWHLLWYLLPVIIVIGWRDAIARMRGATVALGCGAMFLIAVFGGTRVGNWVTDYTTVNRALLHIAPAATVFAAIVVWRWAMARTVGPASAGRDATRQAEA